MHRKLTFCDLSNGVLWYMKHKHPRIYNCQNRTLWTWCLTNAIWQRLIIYFRRPIRRTYWREIFVYSHLKYLLRSFSMLSLGISVTSRGLCFSPTVPRDCRGWRRRIFAMRHNDGQRRRCSSGAVVPRGSGHPHLQVSVQHVSFHLSISTGPWHVRKWRFSATNS
jgi:hypothetical protein